ncbi:MAG: CHRD domain-containing protein [Planctomycetota bacterium]|nr:CHRD domain-containing protein [Planctomycetota bacterium]
MSIQFYSKTAIAIALLSLSACSNSSSSNAGTAFSPTVFTAALSGTQMSPPVTSSAKGEGSVIVSQNQDSIAIALKSTGLTNVDKVHLHLGFCGEDGPVLFNLLETQSFADDFSITVTQADLKPFANLSFAEAINAIRSGQTYLKVHTSQNPDGEIRGQLGVQTLNVNSITAEQLVIPVQSTASGMGLVSVNENQSEIQITVQTQNLTNVEKVHIHLGFCGEAGPVLFNLLEKAPFSDSFSVTVTESDLKPFSGLSFPEAVGAILGGQSYFKVHTTQNPTGETRGQIGTQTLASTLTGADIVAGPVNTTATGNGQLILNGTQDTLRCMLQSSGLVDVTAVHIHLGFPGESGPVLFNLLDTTTFTTDLSLSLTATDLKPASGLSFDEAVNALMTGRAYFKIHTQSFPDGEIRGAIVKP